MDSVDQPTNGGRAPGSAFMALYSAHQRRLFHYVAGLLPNAADADEVFQEVNLVLWENFSQYREGTNFFAWACTIARHRVLQHREKHARAAKLLDPEVLDQLADLAPEAIQRFDRLQRQSMLDCIAELSPGDQELLQQRYAEAVAVQAIAAALNRSANAVSKSLGRIRRLLLACINAKLNDIEQRGEPS
jgi:RNA polymerase sigma-70 factor, ECF subfamily